MASMRVVEQESVLAAPAEAIWARVSTFEGINDELRPLMRMTAPARVRTLEPAGDSATRVSDRLSFEPRLPGSGPLLARFVRMTFSHRHRRLRRRFG